MNGHGNVPEGMSDLRTIVALCSRPNEMWKQGIGSLGKGAKQKKEGTR